MKRCADCGRRSRTLIAVGTGNLMIHLCPKELVAQCWKRRHERLRVAFSLRVHSSKVLSTRVHLSRGK